MDITGSGTLLDPYEISAVPIIDPAAGNLLTCEATGLRADLSTMDSASIDFSGLGTPASPLTAVVLSAGHTHDGTFGPTSLVVGGTNEAGASVPVAASAGAIAIGDFANAGTTTQTIAIGSGVNATAAPSATGLGGIAIGASDGAAINGARASGTSSIAIGSGDASVVGALASGTRAVALGRGAAASGFDATALGTGALATATATLALGRGAAATVVDAIAVGLDSVASATDAMALGRDARSTIQSGLAVGCYSQATTGAGAIAIGTGLTTSTSAPQATGQGAIAVGASNGAAINGARSTGISSIAIGSGTAAAVGASAIAADAIAIGRSASVGSTGGVAVGPTAAAGASSLALGSAASALGSSNQAIGGGAVSSGGNSLAVGDAPTASGLRGIAVGSSATASATDAIAVGRLAIASTAADTIAIGRSATATHANAVALGDAVATTAASQVNIGTKRLFAGVPTTAPADANLIASQLSPWLDEGLNVVAVKVKKSTSVVESGYLPTGLAPRVVEIEDEFPHANVEDGEIGSLGWKPSISASGTTSIVAGIAAHVGIVRLSSGATLGDMRAISNSIALGNGYIIPADVDRFMFIVRLNSATASKARLGFVEDPTAPPGTDGVYFEFDSVVDATNWLTVTRAASTSTQTATAVAMVGNNWFQLEAIRLTSGNWEFYINGTLTNTHATNLPTIALNAVVYVETSEAVGKNLDIDYFGLRAILAPRFT